MQYYNKLRNKEVAFATDSNQLIQLLSVGKMLVVTKETYYPDYVVSNEPFDAEIVASIKDFVGLLK